MFYFVHPDSEMDDKSGQFVISEDKVKYDDIPVVNENEEAQIASEK